MAQNSDADDAYWYRGIVTETELESLENWLNVYRSKYSKVLPSDDASPGIEKWKALLIQDLGGQWMHRVISSVIPCVAATTDMLQAVDIKCILLIKGSTKEPEAFLAAEKSLLLVGAPIASPQLSARY